MKRVRHKQKGKVLLNDKKNSLSSKNVNKKRCYKGGDRGVSSSIFKHRSHYSFL